MGLLPVCRVLESGLESGGCLHAASRWERREGADQRGLRALRGAAGGDRRLDPALGGGRRLAALCLWEHLSRAGQLEMRLGRVFTTWNLFQQIDLLPCIIFSYQKKKRRRK